MNKTDQEQSHGFLKTLGELFFVVVFSICVLNRVRHHSVVEQDLLFENEPLNKSKVWVKAIFYNFSF